MNYMDSGVNRLRWWNSAVNSWIDIGQDESGTLDAHPVIGGDRYSSDIYRVFYNSVSGDMRITAGNQVGGYNTYTSGPPTFTPLWDGAWSPPAGIAVSDGSGILLGGGLDPNGGYSMWSEGSNDIPLFSGFSGSQFKVNTAPHLYNSLFASAVITGSSIFGSAAVHFAAFGESGKPVRYTRGVYGTDEVDEIDWPFDPLAAQYEDVRRTVSVDLAGGRTALALIMSLDGRTRRLEWSAFGDFEELPLPPGFAAVDAMAGQVVVGRDGRWHIIYRERRTGNVMSWSTVAP
jgi:hypothetical protein